MLTLSFFKTFYYELIDFFVDIKNFFVDIFANIHNFLNKFMPDDVLVVFMIAIIAFCAILLFRYIINRR